MAAALTDRLLNTSIVGQILGGLHPNDVRRLIHSGRLQAVKHQVRGRGTKPRMMVRASALDEYIRSLPEVEPEKAARRAGKALRPDVENDLSKATQYV